MLADPTVAALLPTHGMDDDADDKEEDEGDASEIDELLSSKPKRRKKIAKARTGIEEAKLEPSTVVSASVQGDVALTEALKLLKSRVSSGRARKKRKRSDIAAS